VLLYRLPHGREAPIQFALAEHLPIFLSLSQSAASARDAAASSRSETEKRAPRTFARDLVEGNIAPP
jgi:hypothetical protein